MSNINKLDAIANSNKQSLSADQKEHLKNFFEIAELRLRAVNSIHELGERIIQLAINQLCQSSSYISSNTNESFKAKTIPTLYNDLELCLVFVRYGLIAGSNDQINDVFTHEITRLDMPTNLLLEAVQIMKSSSQDLLSKDEFSLAEAYFDCIVDVLERSDIDEEFSTIYPVKKPLIQNTNHYIAELPRSHSEQNIWIHGDRLLSMASGGAFLGGLIANLPGAVTGALIGGIFGWFTKADAASYPKASE